MMGKPIKLTKELKDQAIAEFSNAISNMKMLDGKMSYSKNFTYKVSEKARVLFTPTAYAKMISLIMAFDTEVAWHGAGKRINDSSFLISDILVYPQSVSGATVNMDTEKYAKWLMENYEDDRFNHIVMQGHSHVKMQTSPSPVDKSHQEEILAQLTEDMFYIFMIWNKRLEHTTTIFDISNNILYEDNEIEYGIQDETCDFDEFIKTAKSLVVEEGYRPSTPVDIGSYRYYSYNSTHSKESKDTDQKQIKSKPREKASIGNGWRGKAASHPNK